MVAAESILISMAICMDRPPSIYVHYILYGIIVTNLHNPAVKLYDTSVVTVWDSIKYFRRQLQDEHDIIFETSKAKQDPVYLC